MNQITQTRGNDNEVCQKHNKCKYCGQEGTNGKKHCRSKCQVWIEQRDARVSCHNCGELGHRKYRCPKLPKREYNKVCRYCDEIGHNKRECKLWLVKKQRSEIKLPSERKFNKRKDVYFVIDVSEHMQDGLLDKSKIIMEQIFDGLHNKDRISVITFDEGAYFKLKPRAVKKIKDQGEIPELLDRIYPEGKVSLYDSIYKSISQIRIRNREVMMYIFTAGTDDKSVKSLEDVTELLSYYPNLTLKIETIQKS